MSVIKLAPLIDTFRKHASVTAKELTAGECGFGSAAGTGFVLSTPFFLQPINAKIINTDSALIFLAITLIVGSKR